MIEVSQLHKSFGQQQVLRGVSLTIDEGESVVIIGGSGCGKSVLLRHIIGRVQPDEGDVKIDGDAQALGLCHYPPAELGEPALLDAVGRAAQLVIEEMSGTHHPETRIE